MGSAFDTAFTTDALPGLKDEFGQTVTHWPNGESGSAVSVDDVIFDERYPDLNKEPKGKAVQRRALLLVPSSVSNKKSDVWVINSENWQTERIGRLSGGMREVYAVITETSKTVGNRDARKDF